MEVENSAAKSQDKETTFIQNNYQILNNIIEKFPHHIYVKDLKSRFIKANKSMIEFLGFKEETELLGKTDMDIFNPETAESFLKEEQDIIKTGKQIIGKEHLEKHQNGQITWGQTSKFPLFDNIGKIVGTFGITIDLTNRKQIENDLKDNQYKFRQLIKNSTLGIKRIDEDGKIIMANPAFVKMVGYDFEEEVIRKETDDFFPNSYNRNKFLQMLKREERVLSFEEVLLKKDKTPIEIRESAWAVKDPFNNVIYYEVIAEDITEQNEVLKILHEAEYKYRTLIDNLNEAVYLIIDRKIEMANSKFLELFEFTEEEIYSSDFDLFKYIKPEHKDLLLEREQKITIGEYVPPKFQIGIVTKNGNEKEVEISESYLTFYKKKAIQGIIRDLTEFKKTETQIRHLQKMEAIGTLAAGIAHEINTPSQFINDNLFFLKDVNKSLMQLFNYLETNKANENIPKELQEIIKNLDASYLSSEIPLAIDQSITGIERIAKIVGAMRNFSHQGPKEKVLTDLHQLIQNSITISKHEWKYFAKFETEFDESLPNILCQNSDIGQVIVNLIVNASHALESKFKNKDTLEGRIKIKTKNKNDFAEIIISDNGIGIPKDIKDRIFEPFFTTKEVGKGTGQGLTIAYDIIVTKHKGTIEVESEENVGTEIKINLPIILSD